MLVSTLYQITNGAQFIITTHHFCPLFVHYFPQNRPKQTIFHNHPFLKNVDFLRFIKSHKHTYQPCNRICESEILSRKKPLQILCKGCKIILEKGYRLWKGGQSRFCLEDRLTSQVNGCFIRKRRMLKFL